MSELKVPGVGAERVLTFDEGQETYVRRASSKDSNRWPLLTNLNFKNTHLSKTHAIVRFRDGKFQIRDESSTFGTVINNDFLMPGEDNWADLNEGDLLGFILTKPSGSIRAVREEGGDDTQFIPLEKFKSPSLGLLFKIGVDSNTISFTPVNDIVEVEDEESVDEWKADAGTPDVTCTILEADNQEGPSSKDLLYGNFNDSATSPEPKATTLRGCHALMAHRLKNLDVSSGLPKLPLKEDSKVFKDVAINADADEDEYEVEELVKGKEDDEKGEDEAVNEDEIDQDEEDDDEYITSSRHEYSEEESENSDYDNSDESRTKNQYESSPEDVMLVNFSSDDERYLPDIASQKDHDSNDEYLTSDQDSEVLGEVENILLRLSKGEYSDDSSASDSDYDGSQLILEEEESEQSESSSEASSFDESPAELLSLRSGCNFCWRPTPAKHVSFDLSESEEEETNSSDVSSGDSTFILNDGGCYLLGIYEDEDKNDLDEEEDPDYIEHGELSPASRKRGYDEIEEPLTLEHEAIERPTKKLKTTAGSVIKSVLKEMGKFVLYAGVTIIGLSVYGTRLEEERNNGSFNFSRLFDHGR